MPAFTPIRDFIDALKSGETNITKRLDYVFANYAQVPTAARDAFTAWNPMVSSPIPASVKDVLRHAGNVGNLVDTNKLSAAEVNHLDALPPALKSKLHGFIRAAQMASLALKFEWELHRAAADDAAQDPGPPVKITFKTAAQSVKLGGPLGIPLASIDYT